MPHSTNIIGVFIHAPYDPH